jgi:predicted RND superfamily exporter protein
VTVHPQAGPSDRVRAFVRWTLANARWIWLVAAVAGLFATARTAQLYMHLRSEIEELLPREAPSVLALDEMRARSPGLQFLGIVVEAKDASELPAGERFLDDLAARIRAYPPALVRDVRSGYAREREFVEKHAPLYVSVADLREVRRRIEARREYEVAKAAGSLLDDTERPPSTDVSDIQKRYDSAGKDVPGRLTNVDMKTTMLFVEAGDFTTGPEQARALLGRVKSDVAALDIKRYALGLRVGYASDIASNVEELDALESDLSVSSILVVLAVIAVIVIYYRWWTSVPVLILPLFLATVYAFALASLPPLRVTELNSNSAFLGSIIIGNGINVGLVLLARYREARAGGHGVEEALVIGVWGARPGTLAAAVAASAAYASLAVTEFRAFRQFGYIGGIGMLTSWGTAFVLVPPLLAWLDKDSADTVAKRRHTTLMRYVVRLVEARAAWIVAIAAAATVLSVYELSKFDSSRLEYDLQKLRRADTWTKGEGYWGRKMDALLGHYLTPTVLLFDSQDQARRVEEAVRESVNSGVLKPMVARVVSLTDVLPDDQPVKIAEVRAIRAALTPKIRSLLTAEQRRDVERVLGDVDLEPITAESLPRALTTGLREKDGSMGRTLLVYPRPSDALWKSDTMNLFVSTLRELASGGATEGGLRHGERPGRVSGPIPLTTDILGSIGHDAPLASAVSFVAVVLVVFVVVRSWVPSMHVLRSLLLGVIWLGAVTMATGIKINFSNFIALPITFGIGVDYSVNVITRYVQDGRKDIRGAILSTGGAVALCSLTTIIGYSSLLLAENRALFLFGVVAVTGEVACLTAAIVVLPAYLVFRSGGRREE